MNAFRQFRMVRPDYDLHFLHAPGAGPDAMPLLLMHGWPGSVFEFMDFIPRLTNPRASEAIPPTPSPARMGFAHADKLIGTHINMLAEGGHFAALEQPEAPAQDVRAFFRPLRARLPLHGRRPAAHAAGRDALAAGPFRQKPRDMRA